MRQWQMDDADGFDFLASQDEAIACAITASLALFPESHRGLQLERSHILMNEAQWCRERAKALRQTNAA